MSDDYIATVLDRWAEHIDEVPVAIVPKIMDLARRFDRIEKATKRQVTYPASPVFQDRVKELCALGKTPKEIAAALNSSPAYVYKTLKCIGCSSHEKHRHSLQLLETVEKLWAEGKSLWEIQQATGFGGNSIVQSARKRLGVERIPLRNPPKVRNSSENVSLIHSSDIDRHIVRRINETEYVVRDGNFREELWRLDPHGIVFRNRVRLSFVIVMGMTERRIPADLARIYPA